MEFVIKTEGAETLLKEAQRSMESKKKTKRFRKKAESTEAALAKVELAGVTKVVITFGDLKIKDKSHKDRVTPYVPGTRTHVYTRVGNSEKWNNGFKCINPRNKNFGKKVEIPTSNVFKYITDLKSVLDNIQVRYE